MSRQVEAGNGRGARGVGVVGLDWRSGDEGIALQYANEILIQKEFFYYFFQFISFISCYIVFLTQEICDIRKKEENEKGGDDVGRQIFVLTPLEES